MSLPFFHILSSGKNIFIISFLEEMISHQETRTIQMSIYILDSLSLQKKKNGRGPSKQEYLARHSNYFNVFI